MKSLRYAAVFTSKGFPLVADEITELHVSRILLLLKYCGVIDGAFKLAKLDCCVRYPEFFDRTASYLGRNIQIGIETLQSIMIRVHYGSWDKRYNHVLPFLKARGLIEITQESGALHFSLSPLGLDCADRLSQITEFQSEIKQMKRVQSLLGSKTAQELKGLLYKILDADEQIAPAGEMS